MLAGLFGGYAPRFRLGLALEIELNCSADELLQGGLIDFVAFADVDGAPDLSFVALVEGTSGVL